MPTLAQDQYLTTEVLTATPQKLHLMLIDGVIRLGERARQCWGEGDDEKAGLALVQAQRIMMEIIAGVRREVAGDLAKRVSAIYWFIYRSLVDANKQHDEKSLDDALRILRVERETWRLLCEQLGNNPANADAAGSATFSDRMFDQAQPTPPPPADRPWAGVPRADASAAPLGGFSFEV